MEMKNLFAVLIAAILVPACASDRPIMVGAARPAISPGAVRIYETPPRRFERIALLNSSAGTTWIFSDRASLDDAIAGLRSKAAAVGANGVLLQQIYSQPAGGLSIGVGGFGVGAGDHGIYAGGGGATLGGPLTNHRVRATAIYVH